MDKTEVKITIDADGTVRREIIEPQPVEPGEKSLFKRLISGLSLCVTTQGNRN